MSIVRHGGKIVGADYKTVISHDGAAVVSHGGLRPTSDREWRMIWDGYHFAQPTASCVLYLPGFPCQGSTIYDYSYNFGDSGIDTDEEATAGETAIDCDADATTACPVGSIIQVEDEYMKVTGTGTTLTVVRGYLNSADVLHDTNKDIYVWIPNNGTISGAGWTSLPNGLCGLNFDGTDDQVDLGTDSSLNFTTGNFTFEFWIYPNSWPADGMVFCRGLWQVDGYYIKGQLGSVFRVETQQSEAYQTSSCPIAKVPTLTYSHVMVVRNGTSIKIIVNGVDETTISGTHTNPTTSARNAYLGEYDDGTQDLDSKIFLFRTFTEAKTVAYGLSQYNEERHLFGV